MTRLHKSQLRAIALAAASVACVVFALSGCRNAQEKVTGRGSQTVVIDGCEYIAIENGGMAMNNYSFAITHKGNCKNPIHRMNGGNHD